MLLRDRTALVTGSSSGIGAGVAKAFAAEGARVVVNYPDASQRANAEAVVDVIISKGGEALAVMADVSDEEQVEHLVFSSETSLGPVELLVNNAGIGNVAALEDLAIEDWDRVFAVHVRGTFLVTRRIIKGMYERDYGRIINTASQLAYKGAAGLTHYTASKGAILSFTRSLALEVGARNINVNAVAPGATRTPILGDISEEVLEAIRQGIPKGRIAEVDDIVPSYVFLASDAAKHIQGQCLSPNGGDVFL